MNAYRVILEFQQHGKIRSRMDFIFDGECKLANKADHHGYFDSISPADFIKKEHRQGDIEEKEDQ